MKGVTCSLSVLCVFIPLSSSRALLPSLPPSPLSSSPACTGPSYPAAFAGGRRDRLGGRSRTSTETAAEQTCSQRWAYSQSPEGRGAMNAAIRGGCAGFIVDIRRGAWLPLEGGVMAAAISWIGPVWTTQPHTFMNSQRNTSLFPLDRTAPHLHSPTPS